MKKSFYLLLSLCFIPIISMNAQIEEYVDEVQQTETISDAEIKSNQLALMGKQKYPTVLFRPYDRSNRSEQIGPFDLRGHQLYCVNDFNHNKYNDGIFAFTLNNSTKKPDIVKIESKQTFVVEDILLLNSEFQALVPYVDQLLGDTVCEYVPVGFSKGKPKSFISNKHNINGLSYYLSHNNGYSETTLGQSGYYKGEYGWYGDAGCPIYVLKDNDGKNYYIPLARRCLHEITDFFGKPNTSEEVISLACIGDFISETSYKYYDSILVGKQIAEASYRQQEKHNVEQGIIDTFYCGIINKVILKDKKISVQYTLSCKDGRKSYCEPLDSIYRTTMSYYNRDSLLYISGPSLCFKYEVDSIFAKWGKEYDAQQKKKAAEDKQKILELQKKYGAENGKLIAEGKVKVGMTKAMCIEALGKPCEISSSTNSLGKYEILTYYLFCSDKMLHYGIKYIHILNGKITQIDTD